MVQNSLKSISPSPLASNSAISSCPQARECTTPWVCGEGGCGQFRNPQAEVLHAPRQRRACTAQPLPGGPQTQHPEHDGGKRDVPPLPHPSWCVPADNHYDEGRVSSHGTQQSAGSATRSRADNAHRPTRPSTHTRIHTHTHPHTHVSTHTQPYTHTQCPTTQPSTHTTIHP
jgi:hypothetical protein